MKVGDYLYHIEILHGIEKNGIEKIQIIKIGKKYIHTKYMKIDIKTLKEISVYKPIQCFSSLEAIERYKKRRNQESFLMKNLCQINSLTLMNDENIDKLYELCKEIFKGDV